MAAFAAAFAVFHFAGLVAPLALLPARPAAAARASSDRDLDNGGGGATACSGASCGGGVGGGARKGVAPAALPPSGRRAAPQTVRGRRPSQHPPLRSAFNLKRQQQQQQQQQKQSAAARGKGARRKSGNQQAAAAPAAFSWADMAAQDHEAALFGGHANRRLGNCVVCRMRTTRALELHFIRKTSKALDKEYMFTFLPFARSWASHQLIDAGQPCPEGAEMMAESVRESPAACLVGSFWYLQRFSPNPGMWDERVMESGNRGIEVY